MLPEFVLIERAETIVILRPGSRSTYG